VLVRSVTTRSLRTPHTGAVGYDEKLPKIPAAAVATEDADFIHRRIAKGEKVVVKLRLTPQSFPDAPSANVIAEITGREKPEEVVVIGGHLDSWDNGRGAIDNGSGVAVVMDAIRIIHASGMRPRRTIRVVLFTNEENGLKGGKAYAKDNNDDLWRHVAAIEHDLGAGAPTGFRTTLAPGEIARLTPWVTSLARLGALRFATEEGTGADTSPLTEACVTGFGAMPDTTSYFDYHHTEADTLDKVDPALLRQNVAAMVTLTWALAEMPERIR
jgi:Zn-dependent M28 family amino/carboxypeptidase